MATVTGRLSQDPNFQWIRPPNSDEATRLVAEFRKAFPPIRDFGKNLDFSDIETRVMAHYASEIKK